MKNKENQAPGMADIVEAIRGGSEKAVLRLYENYRDEFLSWATRNHKVSVEEAKDVFQDAVIAFYRNVKAGKGPSADVTVKTYLFSIGKNILLNFLKKRSLGERWQEQVEVGVDNQISEEHDRDHVVQFVKRIYEQMGSPCREILMLYYEKGFNMADIAAEVGYKNQDVAKKKKYECLKLLEQRIDKEKIKNIINR